MAVRKITKRWLINSMSVIFIILIAIIIVFSFGIKAFYYNNVRQIITAQANVVSTLLSGYAEDKTTDFSTQTRQMVESFEAREIMELMAIDVSGNVIITSSGFQPAQDAVMPDFFDALQSSDGYGEYIGMMNEEKIMALTFTVSGAVADSQLAAMRYVTTLDDVDSQIVFFIVIVTLLSIAILFFVIFSSSYFIKSIVNPVGEVGKTARKIAQGDFNARLTKHNDDEIGELCDIINYMAQELAANEKLKNDFISSVSHELRTPLTAIKGWAETLLQEQPPEPQTMQKGMGVIINETQRLSQMVEELLDFSRIQNGKLKLVYDRLDVIAELSDAVLMFTERAKREGMSLLYEEPDLIVPVYGDKNRLRQVFINVIDNALKYSDSGDTISVTATVCGEQVRISISDTGSGISEEDLPKVTTKFYKGTSTRRGSGIGLAVVDEIVSMHSGQLIIESKKNTGTTVTIILPIQHKKSEDLPIGLPIG